jgi:hypothetical protein
MFKKIVEFFTGKKTESKYAHPLDAVTKSNPGHPGWPTPVPQAPYKVPEPAATTPIPLIVTNSNPADNVPIAESELVVPRDKDTRSVLQKLYDAETAKQSMEKGYVQNEEQAESNVWSTVNSISQNDYINERGVQATQVYNSIPQMNHLNITQDKNTVPNEGLADRINPDLLDAFKNNPYTQNLNSWA